MNVDNKQGLNAIIGFNNDFYHFDTMSGCGILIADDLFGSYFLSKDIKPETLGLYLKKTLRQSRVINPDEHSFFDYKKIKESYDEWVKNIIGTRGYKNKKALFKNMKHCGVRQVNDLITIRPSNHVKLEAWSGECISETDWVIIPASASDEELGHAIIEGFSRCRGRQF